MSWLLFCLLQVFLIFNYSLAATHDEIPQCSLTGVYKHRQNVLQSPNYPDNYPVSTCWDYVIRSPYRCPTKFHIQFLDFFLESSPNCSNDYLAIGSESDGDDMDLLCGQVIGIKKYHTPDGILRLRFYSDDSPWTRGKGFKLLVTRLACEREELLRNVDDEDEEDDTVTVNALNDLHKMPEVSLPALFRNFSDQYKPYPLRPLLGWNLPYPPAPPGFYIPAVPQVPGTSSTTEKPCTTDNKQGTQDYIPQVPVPVSVPTAGYWPVNQPVPVPLIPDQYVNPLWQPPALRANSIDPTELAKQVDSQFNPPLTDACCISAFRQKHLYLSSPGFPRTVFSALRVTQRRDCEFHLEKSSSSVCRVRFEFKFFDFGQPRTATGLQQSNIEVAIGTSRDICTDDYVEIDGERFCGCRSGYTYNSLWPSGKKQIRMRMGYSGIPSNGFLLEIHQDECTADELLSPNRFLGGTAPQRILGGSFNGQNGFLGATAPQRVLGGSLNGQNGYPLTAFGQQNQFSNQLQTQLPNQLSLGQYPQLTPGQPGQFWQQPYQPYPLTGNTQQLQQQQLQQQQLQQQQLQQQQQQQQLFSNSNPYGLQGSHYGYGRNGRSSQYARSSSTTQPVSVVETNSTRKEYYYFDGDEAFQSRSSINRMDGPDDGVTSEDPARLSLRYTNPSAQLRNRCSFDMSDILKLTVDPLWITKPICYAPLRSWFSNIFG